MNHRIESMRPSASMVLMAKEKELQKQDPTVIGLAGGEPDFSTPDRISMAAIRSLSEGYESMRNIVILNSLAFSYPLPVLMRVEYNSLIVK